MKNLNEPRGVAQEEPPSSNSSLYLGQVYFFGSTQDRDQFEASHPSGAAMSPVDWTGDAPPRLSSPARTSNSPIASFLG